MMKKIQYCFLLALLLHLLIVLRFTFEFMLHPDTRIYTPKQEAQHAVYIPTYMYHPPAMASQAASSKNTPLKNIPISKLGIKKNQMVSKTPSHIIPKEFQLQPASYAPQIQMQRTKSEKTFDDPLLQLLHRATAEHLIYPDIAASFHETGTAHIGFLVSPNGTISNIMLLKSSGYDILDKAALSAIHAISPVNYVNYYINKPKYVTAIISFV